MTQPTVQTAEEAAKQIVSRYCDPNERYATVVECISTFLTTRDAAIRADERGRTAQWRDIATAPKDGTAFLAYGLHTEDEPIGAARGVKAGDHWWAILLFDIWQQHRFRFAKDGTFPWSEPTHWMPLPPPPQPTKQESTNG